MVNVGYTSDADASNEMIAAVKSNANRPKERM
jgi:hypothetical protein